MNKKGGIGLAILSTIGIFIIGFMFLNFLMPEVTQFRADMSCASADEIHDGGKNPLLNFGHRCPLLDSSNLINRTGGDYFTICILT